MVLTSSTPISFEEFRHLLSEILLIDEEQLTPSASFVDDLYVDSLRWAEMAIRIEDLGAQIPTEAFWEIDTVQGAYDCYRSHLAKASPMHSGET